MMKLETVTEAAATVASIAAMGLGPTALESPNNFYGLSRILSINLLMHDS